MLVPQNEAEMAAHSACVSFLVNFLSHPNVTWVSDSLEILVLLSDHMVLGWEVDDNPTVEAEISTALLKKITSLLAEGYVLFLFSDEAIVLTTLQ